jgi:hypothetical protein
MASNTSANWPSYRCSNSSIRRAKPALAAASSRTSTNARMIATLTSTARRLCRTLESIATPCSVNTRGGFRLPPCKLEVTICDFKSAASRRVNRKAKSAGNLAACALDSSDN